MNSLLTNEQRQRYDDFRRVVAADLAPSVQAWDMEGKLPASVLTLLADAGYLGALVPEADSGQGWDTVTFGLLCEAVARVSCAVADIITVQTMVALSLAKWGTIAQRKRWLSPLARGEAIGAFALTEPHAGSATQNFTTNFQEKDGHLVLTGTKTYISAGQFADVFLVFGKLADQPLACLVPRGASGVTVEPITDMLGYRAAGLATVSFQEVELEPVSVVGKPGFGLSHIAQTGLHYGRISTACSAAGLLRACFEESLRYGSIRKAGDRRLGELGMIQSLLARMGTDLEAAQLLCYQACRANDERLPQKVEKALAAKYFSSTAAARAAADAVQIHGAAGCRESSPVARYYRDAKLIEIMEGTTQIHESMLAQLYLERLKHLD